MPAPYSAKITAIRRVVCDAGDGEMSLPLGAFFAANIDGIDAAEQALIVDMLGRGLVFHGGGGAEATWTVRLATVLAP